MAGMRNAAQRGRTRDTNFIAGDVRFEAHCGLKSDIAPCPLSADKASSLK
jgi:hypothetical protein